MALFYDKNFVNIRQEKIFMGDYHMDLKEKTELTDEELDQVVGGVRRTVYNNEGSGVYVYSGPGLDTDDFIYKVVNGDTVYTTGYHEVKNGYDWYELDDGNWIQGNFIGY